MTQSSAARPPAGSASPVGPLGPARLRLGRPDQRNQWPARHVDFGILDTGATHNAVAALLHASAGACFVFVVCCVCVCGPACCACCGVLQRRHNFDEFLKRLESRQPCKLTFDWLGRATRDSSSDDSLSGHLRIP